MRFSGDGEVAMTTDSSLAIAPEARPRALQAARSWPIGRWLLITIVLGWFGLLVLVPSAALVRQVIAGGWRPFFQTLATPEVIRAFGLSLGITALATVINTIFGVMLAMVLVRQKFWGRSLLDGVVDLPFAVSPIVAGLMLIMLYGPQGWLGRWLQAGGIRVIYALPGMVLATLFVTVPFVARELIPVLREIGQESEQAAYTLGAGRWRTFWSITVPSIRWGLAYGITLTVARSLGEFGAVLVVSGNLIGQTQTATLYIHDGIESFHTEGAYAASLVLGALSFVLLVGMDAIRRRLDRQEGRDT
jgi:sulfate transport system permease protein